MISKGAAIVLGGGRSSRIGRDKGQLKLDDRSLFEIVSAKLTLIFDKIVVVTNTPESFDAYKEFQIVTDEIPFQGPLGGILAGLSASPREYNLVIAYDMPFLNLDLIEFLFTQASSADVVIPCSEKGIEPLFAVYSRNCIPAIRDKMRSGEKRVISFFDEVKVKYVAKEVIEAIDPGYLSFFNVNTEQDWERAKKIHRSLEDQDEAD
jgi:molybdopterin-guanine dinucleotide biosynthesis protein A